MNDSAKSGADRQKELIEPISIAVEQEQQTAQFSKQKIITLAVGLSALLLILVLWFIVSAKIVVVTITPEPDTVTLSEGSFAIKLQQRFLAQPGKFILRASKQGYYPLEEEISIGRLDRYNIERSLQKKPGIISIATNNQQAALVYIDQQYVGVAPLTDISLTPGTHAVELLQYRFQTLITEVQVDGAGQQQSITFDLIPDWAMVSVASKPVGANIWLDGEQIGVTPLAIEVDAGTRHLELIHPDYAAYITDFALVANEDLDLGEIELNKTPTHLVINSTPGNATVYVNEQQRGTTPLTITAAPNTSYQLRLVKSGYRPLTRSVQVAAGERKAVNIGLQAILGTINMQVTPSTASVYVDGKKVGTGNQTLTLNTRQHLIEVRESGYSTEKITAVPDVNHPLEYKVALTLKNNSGAKGTVIKNSQGQTLRLITPRGQFTMGASRREQGRRSNESLRKVELTRPFYIAVHEVSNEQFARFEPSYSSGDFRGVNLSAAKQPVVNISWQQAARYCNWLSEQEDLPITYREQNGKLVASDAIKTGYRLVTEAEWAWVARVRQDGSLLRYAWGDQYPPSAVIENYADSQAQRIVRLSIPNYDDGFAGPAPIGSFAVNHNGVFDIAANVAEWMHDYYSIYSSSDKISIDPVGPTQGKHHVIRGASWLRGELSNTRLAYRDYSEKSRPDVGFRLARYVK